MTAPGDQTDPTDPTRAGAPRPDGDRRGALIAAALADDLSPAEADEFARLRADDPTVDDELDLLGGVVARTAVLDGWHEVTPDDDLRRRVHAVAEGPAAASPSGLPTDTDLPPAVVAGTGTGTGTGTSTGEASDDAPLAPVTPLRRRRLLLTALGAAACLAVGAGLGALAVAPRDTAVEGPPGTLGAVEHLDFTGVPAGVDLDADLVAHTWGTETVLVVDGLPVGDEFSVVVVDDRGQEFSSGAFLGSEVPVDCRLNAAVLREHVAAVEIRGTGGEVVTAEVPPVGA